MWVVILRSSPTEIACCYGPFTVEKEADGFAAYLTAEVDPAVVLPLSSAVNELLSFHTHVRRRGDGA